jgi:hypothetical protein
MTTYATQTQEVDGVPIRLRLLAVLPARMLDNSVLLWAELEMN